MTQHKQERETFLTPDGQHYEVYTQLVGSDKQLTLKLTNRGGATIKHFRVPMLPISLTQPESRLLALVPFLVDMTPELSRGMAYYKLTACQGLACFLNKSHLHPEDYLHLKKEWLKSPLITSGDHLAMSLDKQKESDGHPEGLVIYGPTSMEEVLSPERLEEPFRYLMDYYQEVYPPYDDLEAAFYAMDLFGLSCRRLNFQSLSGGTILHRLMKEGVAYTDNFVNIWLSLLAGVPIEYLLLSLAPHLFEVKISH